MQPYFTKRCNKIARKGVKFCTFWCRILHLFFLKIADSCGFLVFLFLIYLKGPYLLRRSVLKRCPIKSLKRKISLVVCAGGYVCRAWSRWVGCGQAVVNASAFSMGCPCPIHGRSAARRAVHISTGWRGIFKTAKVNNKH